MITKYTYSIVAGKVTRQPAYTFTALEDLFDRLSTISNIDTINGIASRTLQGESERPLIDKEDAWFKVQTSIQDMDAERVSLEAKLKSGDASGNPLSPTLQKNVAARIADLKAGSITVTKQFYNHYTRQTMSVEEVVQTSYTVSLEKRTDLEQTTPYLAGLRGISAAPTRPAVTLDPAKDAEIRKILVRQKIGVTVGDDKDIIADLANAFNAIIKKVGGQAVTPVEEALITKYSARQAQIATILATDYKK
jgi:hypothetical protein